MLQITLILLNIVYHLQRAYVRLESVTNVIGGQLDTSDNLF